MNKKPAVAALILVLLLGVDIAPATTSSPAAVTPSVNVTWSSFVPFTSGLRYDFSPFVLQASDGRAWVFWETASYLTPWLGSIHYKINNSSVWSPEQVAVPAANTVQIVSPSAAQLKNGTIYLSYSSNRTGNFEVFLKSFNPSSGWSGDYQVTSAMAEELDSSLLAASDGSLWIFYDRYTSSGTNIYYKTYRNGAWSNEAALTSDLLPIRNKEPSAFQTRDGTIWVAWSQALNTLQTVHIVYKTFNSATWSAPVQVTFSSSPDNTPTGIQDSNGTIWIVWSRNIPYSCTAGGCAQADLFYITSTNNGANWSSETALTNDTACVDPNCFDDVQPRMAQLMDGRAYVFWRTNRDPGNYWNIYYVASSQLPFHRVAVTKISAAPSMLRVGRLLTVNVTVANTGAFTETFQLNVQATNKTAMTAGTGTITLAPSTSTTSTVIWNTTTAPYGRYVISANIPPVPYQFITINNFLTGPKIALVPRGDVDLDGSVDIVDVALVAIAFGSVPGSPTWNPAADLNYDGRIDIVDVAIVAFWFGASI
jgi:hypothetical protein